MANPIFVLFSGFREVCAAVGRGGLQQVEGDAQPGLLGGHGVARRSVPSNLVSVSNRLSDLWYHGTTNLEIQQT